MKISIKFDDFDRFRDIAVGVAANLPKELYTNRLHYDIETPISDFDIDLVELVENSFHKIRFLSKENTFYSPPSIMKGIHGLLFLEKNRRRCRTITFGRGVELVEDFKSSKPSTADVVYEVSVYGSSISYVVKNWQFD